MKNHYGADGQSGICVYHVHTWFWQPNNVRLTHCSRYTPSTFIGSHSRLNPSDSILSIPSPPLFHLTRTKFGIRMTMTTAVGPPSPPHIHHGLCLSSALLGSVIGKSLEADGNLLPGAHYDYGYIETKRNNEHRPGWTETTTPWRTHRSRLRSIVLQYPEETKIDTKSKKTGGKRVLYYPWNCRGFTTVVVDSYILISDRGISWVRRTNENDGSLLE